LDHPKLWHKPPKIAEPPKINLFLVLSLSGPPKVNRPKVSGPSEIGIFFYSCAPLAHLLLTLTCAQAATAASPACRHCLTHAPLLPHTAPTASSAASYARLAAGPAQPSPHLTPPGPAASPAGCRPGPDTSPARRHPS
jgi:hypothetical protein